MACTKHALLRILKFMVKTDADHPVNSSQLCKLLEETGLKAERKSVTDSIHCLMDEGFGIKQCEKQKLGFYMDREGKLQLIRYLEENLEVG